MTQKIFADIIFLAKEFNAALSDESTLPDGSVDLNNLLKHIIDIVLSIGDPDLLDDTKVFVRELFMGEIPSYGLPNLLPENFSPETKKILCKNFGFPEGQVLSFPANA